MPQNGSKLVHLETFGCQMNELDSELVVGQLRGLGYRFTADAGEADVVLYNTCSVRERAEQKVWSRLGEVGKAKRRRPELVVGVLGCMAERDGAALIDRMPQVDILCGPGELDKLPALLDNAVKTRASLGASASAGQIALQGGSSRRAATLAAAEDTLELLDLSRSVSPVDVGHQASAYVRITRGCNKFCTYCVVPFTRGAEIHRPPDHIVDECKRLADAGVIEITLLGQTVNHYRFEHGAAVSVNGLTQPQKGRAGPAVYREPAGPVSGRVTTFADLLRRIHEEVPAVQRLRFVTSYPRDFGPDVLQAMRDSPRVCRYIHGPAQSGSDRMLQLMNRGYSVAEYDEWLARCREALHEPDKGRPLMLSGDIIVGFPTETEDDFRATVRLLERARYKNCFIFKYSPRPGTVAYDNVPDDVPDEAKRRRNNELLAVQARISGEISAEQVGREFDVLVEGFSRREKKRRGADVKPGTGMVALTLGGRELSQEDAGLATLETDNRSLTVAALAGESAQMAGRTDGDLIVHFDTGPHAAPDDLIGRIVRCRITAGTGLALTGELAEQKLV